MQVPSNSYRKNCLTNHELGDVCILRELRVQTSQVHLGMTLISTGQLNLYYKFKLTSNATKQIFSNSIPQDLALVELSLFAKVSSTCLTQWSVFPSHDKDPIKREMNHLYLATS